MYIYTCLYIYSYIYTAQEWKHHTPNATNGSIHRFWFAEDYCPCGLWLNASTGFF